MSRLHGWDRSPSQPRGIFQKKKFQRLLDCMNHWINYASLGVLRAGIGQRKCSPELTTFPSLCPFCLDGRSPWMRGPHLHRDHYDSEQVSINKPGKCSCSQSGQVEVLKFLCVTWQSESDSGHPQDRTQVLSLVSGVTHTRESHLSI